MNKNDKIEGQIGKLSEIKILVSEHLDDGLMVMSPNTFMKFKHIVESEEMLIPCKSHSCICCPFGDEYCPSTPCLISRKKH